MCSIKKVVLRILQKSQENTCVRVQYKLMPKTCNLNKKETPTHVVSCEFREIFKNIFFVKHLRRCAPAYLQQTLLWLLQVNLPLFHNPY